MKRPPDPIPPDPTPPPVEIPIDGVLDLHPFRPAEIKGLVLDYLAECQARGILQVRLIHGKGIGALKRTVHVLLSSHPDVLEFWLDHTLFSGSGATCVRLRPAAPPSTGQAPAPAPPKAPDPAG